MSNGVILIIDDEPQIRKLLTIILTSHNYKVLEAESGNMGKSMAAMYSPDVILLDIGLPDISGQELLKEIRMWYDKSIIMLTVLNGENDLVMALDNGATDYLTKPFRNAELLARIRASLRHNKNIDPQKVYVFGDLTIDPGSRSITKAGNRVHLTGKEFELLVLFSKNEGRVVTHQFILREIWGVSFQEESQYVRVYVASLRKKIETNPANPVHIITESRIGYRFQ